MRQNVLLAVLIGIRIAFAAQAFTPSSATRIVSLRRDATSPAISLQPIFSNDLQYIGMVCISELFTDDASRSCMRGESNDSRFDRR